MTVQQVCPAHYFYYHRNIKEKSRKMAYINYKITQVPIKASLNNRYRTKKGGSGKRNGRNPPFIATNNNWWIRHQ
jgi:hypothetical protein